MRILGIDPGFAITGYSVIDYIGNKFNLVTSGAILTEAGESFPLRLEKIYRELNDLILKFKPEIKPENTDTVIDEYKPDAMSIEELFFNNNVKTAINVAQARGVILMTARINNVATYEYTPLQVKQAVVRLW